MSSPELLTPSRVADLLDRHGIRPSRALGQNFVTDANTVRRIADLAGVGPGDHVIEIGPGLGSLSLALAATGARVTAIEVDRHVLGALAETVEPHGVEVIHADVREVDWDPILGDGPAHLVANLPYNIATPLVADLLDDEPRIASMLVMVQREVAERLAAGPGTGAYGAVSVKVAFWATAKVVGAVSPNVFTPRPKVTSALVQIVRRPEPLAPDIDPARLFGVVRQAFGQRRKMLRRSLADVAAPEKLAAAAESVGLSVSQRPEELSVDDWIAFVRSLDTPDR